MTTYQLPPSTGKHVVLLHQIARALNWSAARVRGVDDLLEPIRLADGARAYDVERARLFIWTMDTINLRSQREQERTRARRRRSKLRSAA